MGWGGAGQRRGAGGGGTVTRTCTAHKTPWAYFLATVLHTLFRCDRLGIWAPDFRSSSISSLICSNDIWQMIGPKLQP